MSAAPPAVSRADARRALLHYQLAPRSLDEVVQRLGSVQVDPLAPMGRNHDLVLQARVDARLRIHGWWWEELRPDAHAAAGLQRGLARFLRYLGADAVALPRGLDRPTRALWQAAAAEART